MIHPDDLKRADLAGPGLRRRIPGRRENATIFSGRQHGATTIAAVETNPALGRFGRNLAVAVGTAVLAVFSTVVALDEVAASQVTTEATPPAPAAGCWVSPDPFGGER